MKKVPLFSILVALVFLAGTLAFAGDQPKPMTDDDVIAMVKAGLPDDTIISAINAQSTNFDVSAMALVNLKNQGVSVKVIDALLAAGKKQQDAHSSSAPASGANSSATGTGSGTSAPVQREQFAPSTNSNQPPAGNASPGGQNSSSADPSAPAQHTSFIDRLNQTQNAITGTIQQGQSNYQQVRAGMPGHQQNNAAGQTQGANPGTNPGAAVAPAVNAQPATPGAYPAATNPPASNQAAQSQQQLRQQQMQQQRDAASRQAALQQQQAAMQQQRQQQAAMAQQRAAKIAACRQQAQKAYPKGGPDFARAYASCIQAP